jgi:hypothetical protein
MKQATRRIIMAKTTRSIADIQSFLVDTKVIDPRSPSLTWLNEVSVEEMVHASDEKLKKLAVLHVLEKNLSVGQVSELILMPVSDNEKKERLCIICAMMTDRIMHDTTLTPDNFKDVLREVTATVCAMPRFRVTFRSEIFFVANDAKEAQKKFEGVYLFSDAANKFGAGFVEVMETEPESK